MYDQLLVGDCVRLMRKLPAGSVDLAFADPPFNIGYEYDRYDDRRSRADYLAWADEWLAGVRRLLKPTGSLFVAIGDEYVAEHKVRLDAMGLTLRNWIVWHYTFGVNCTSKFNRSHAHILYYVADPKRYRFNAGAVRVPSARQTTYADRRANPRGKLPDDTWVLRPQEGEEFFRPEGDTWYASRVCGSFKERVKVPANGTPLGATTAHPCQMPEAVLERIVRVASDPGDVVFDPFAGSGTTLAVAKRLGRRYLGVELSPDYAEQIERRLERVGRESSMLVKLD
jgi:site-specific DNA-methyltransferase (adenine-specific)